MVFQRVDEQLVELGVDVDRHVLGVADAMSKMAVEQRLLEHVGLVEVVERFLDHLLDEFVEHLDVAGVDQLVAVDAVRLVDVQADEVGRRLAALASRKQQTLPTQTDTPTTRTSQTLNHCPRAAVHRNAATFECGRA